MAYRQRVMRSGLVVLWLVLNGAWAQATEPIPPETRLDTMIESFHGTIVEDPYRWLEDASTPDTTAWFEAQDSYTRRILDALPARPALRQRLAELNGTDTRVHDLQWAGDRIFYLKRAPGEQTYKLYVRDDLAALERMLVDPDAFKEGEQPAAIDYYRASPNGKRIAYGISQGGSENAALRVVEVATGQPLGATIPRARWAAPAWRFDSNALFYTQQRVPVPGALPADLLRRSRTHMRTFAADGAVHESVLFGANLNAAVAIGEDDIPAVETSPVSPFVLGIVQHGVQREVSIYVARLNELRGPATPWRRLAGPERGIVGFDLRGEWIYLVTNEHAPRYQVVRWSLNDKRPYALADAEVLVPESTRVVRGISVAKDALYVQQLDAGYSRLLRLEFNVRLRQMARASSRRASRGATAALPKQAGVARGSEVNLPFPGAIQERITDPLHIGALIRFSGWTESPGYFAVDGKSGAIVRTALLPPSSANFSDVTSTQVRVPGHDGVEVPVSIVHARNHSRDGSARVLLDAYGAYGISQEPFFFPSLLAWIEHGGVFAVAHVRGGGELGKQWHLGGFKATKANSWRDAIAAAQWLVREGWTTPARLAITGGSAGGIVAGNAIIDRPDLFAAMVSQAGFHDTLRGETGMVGPANVPEFGTVASEDGFRDLLAMSSYARLQPGVAYPAALLTTGFNDPRVDPWDPGKMAARLQAINAGPGGSDKAVLLRVDFASGHGAGTTSQLVDEYADIFGFLLWQTQAPGFAPVP
jgi:prolyl oligopeptidase